jgi:hypothetical protein
MHRILSNALLLGMPATLTVIDPASEEPIGHKPRNAPSWWIYRRRGSRRVSTPI